MFSWYILTEVLQKRKNYKNGFKTFYNNLFGVAFLIILEFT